MAFHTLRPDPSLADAVELLWTTDDHRPAYAYERILPSGTVEFVLNLTDGEVRCYNDAGGAARRMREPVLSGVFRRHFVVDTAQQRAMAGVRFKPGGAWRILGLPLDEIADAHVALSSVLGSEARRLAEALATDATPRARLLRLHEALSLRRRREAHPAIAWAVEQGCAYAGRLRLGELVDETGLSRRRFNELFRREVGVTPKVFLRIRRFHEALSRLLHAPDGGSDVAAAAGYADQAHFIREFREFSGVTPESFRHGAFAQPLAFATEPAPLAAAV